MIDPPLACLTKRRRSAPPTQRIPWPNVRPLPRAAVPCQRMQVVLGFSSVVTNTTVSLASEALPVAVQRASRVAEAFSAPRPGPAGGFAHGHGFVVARPGEQKLTKVGGPS